MLQFLNHRFFTKSLRFLIICFAPGWFNVIFGSNTSSI